MIRKLLLFVAALFAFANAAFLLTSCTLWRVAEGPLVTRWAKEVDPREPLPEYPRPQLVREKWRNLNGLWEFKVAEEGESPPFHRELEERILVPYPVESALSGIMKRAERLWYRRVVRIPSSWRKGRVLLHFGASDWETRVWVNGRPIGTHRGGYDSFTFDITGALKPRLATQELIVGVYDPTDEGPQARGKQVRRPQGIWYTATTGIWQTVWLEPVPESHIDRIRMLPDVDARRLLLTVEGKATTPEHSVLAVVSEYGEDIMSATGSVGSPIDISMSDATLWSPENPRLYDLRVMLRDRHGKTIDTVTSYFGMRKISIGKDEDGITRILLNDEFRFQIGPLDQGFWPDGLYTAPTDSALRSDIQVLKRLGYNMVRKHVKIEPARWYYWCDTLGLLVWQDMPSGDSHAGRGRNEIVRSIQSATQFAIELEQLVQSFFNHPSIVMWVIFNEGWGQYDTVRLTEWVRQLDPSRLVSSASGWNDMGVGDVHDIHAYPGPASPPPEERRAAVLGEYGGLGLPLAGHTWQDEENWGYRNLSTKEELTEGYLRLLRRVHRLIGDPGLSAAVYTQTTDVEIEVNGLMTYDREVLKVDPARLAEAHGRLSLAPPEIRMIVPTSQEQGLTWRYTLDPPPEGWVSTDFDDTAWHEGSGGFGSAGTPGSAVRTDWTTSEIWLRRSFDFPEGDFEHLALFLHHDEDAEVYINGVLATEARGYVTTYEEYGLRAEARVALRPAGNVLAVHCRQTSGGQYIDVGIGEIVQTE